MVCTPSIRKLNGLSRNRMLMTDHHQELDPMKKNPPAARPYAPSFLDRFMGFVVRLPLPYWLTYLLLFFLQSLLTHAVAWIAGWLPAFTFNPILFVFPVWLWGPLAFITHLNRVALDALADFSPLLDLDDQRLARLKVEFTVMPARNLLLSALIWSIVYLGLTLPAFEAYSAAFGFGPALAMLVTIEGLISFATGSAIFYHSFRQLRQVNLAVKMVSQFNLFQLDPVYSFSRVTSQIGIAWIIMLSLTLLLFPIRDANLGLLVILALQVVLAVAAFVLPLWFVNRRLVSGKRRLLAEHNRRLESTLERLHAYLDWKQPEQAAQLNSALAGLNLERNVLMSIPTWPWRTGTLTTFLSTLGLPVFIFLLQLLLRKLLGI